MTLQPASGAISDIVRRLAGGRGVENLCTPEAIMRSRYGVVIGEWACPACGCVYELQDYPSPRCSCGRFLPTRCLSSACDGVCEPLVHDHHGKKHWYPPPDLCKTCLCSAGRRAAEQRLKQAFPAGLRALARDYARHEHRRELDGQLSWWLDTDCGRRAEKPKPWVYCFGRPGSGKSVALVYTAGAAYYARGLVRTIAYYEEQRVLWAISHQWDDDLSVRDDARAIVLQCGSVELLVLDEVGARKTMTSRQIDDYRDMLKARCDAELPTMIASNRGPSVRADGRTEIFGWLDERLDSRIAQHALIAPCTGVDLRRTDDAGRS
ncbi:MAG: hypothetical protein ABIL09_11010 [Gemmatimonadota bacterium]